MAQNTKSNTNSNLVEMEAAAAFSKVKDAADAIQTDTANIKTLQEDQAAEESTASEMQAEIEAMDLYAFLPEAAEKRISETKIFPAPPSFRNKQGRRSYIKLRKLSFEEFSELSEKYRETEVVRNKKGRIETTVTGRAAVMRDVDGNRLTDAMIAKSLVFPNLSDLQIMHAYNCMNEEQLVRKIFNTPADYTYISRLVSEYSGIGLTEDDEDESVEEQLVKRAKNS